MRPRAAALLLLLSLPAAPLVAQLSGQSFQVRVDSARVTVGDTVRLRFRLRLDERDLLFDTIPVPAVSDLDGAFVLSVGRLARDTARIFHGEALVAFYRPGHRSVPAFTVTFMRAVKGVQRGVLASDTAWVDVTPVLPPGNPPLRDLRPLEALPTPWWPWLLLAPAGLAAWRVYRRKRLGALPPDISPPLSANAVDPRGEAIERLRRLEDAAWSSEDEVGRRYEEITNVLRDFMGSSELVPARELTTSELLAALGRRHPPAHLLKQCGGLLAEADLVKFAAATAGAEAGRHFLGSARTLIEQWPPARNGSGDAPR